MPVNDPQRRSGDGDVSLGEIARRFDRFEDSMKDEFADMRLQLGNLITRVEYEEYKITVKEREKSKEDRIIVLEDRSKRNFNLAVGSFVFPVLIGLVFFVLQLAFKA